MVRKEILNRIEAAKAQPNITRRASKPRKPQIFNKSLKAFQSRANQCRMRLRQECDEVDAFLSVKALEQGRDGLVSDHRQQVQETHEEVSLGPVAQLIPPTKKGHVATVDVGVFELIDIKIETMLRAGC